MWSRNLHFNRHLDDSDLDRLLDNIENLDFMDGWQNLGMSRSKSKKKNWKVTKPKTHLIENIIWIQPCLDSQVYLSFITSAITRGNKWNKNALTDLKNKPKKKKKRRRMTFVSKWLFLKAPRNQCWNAKNLEQNVQNVLELYFILGCQAHSLGLYHKTLK